jgi:hypothetical protein
MPAFSVNCQWLLLLAKIVVLLLFCAGVIQIFYSDRNSRPQFIAKHSDDPFQQIRDRLAAAYSLQGDYNWTLSPVAPHSQPDLAPSSHQSSPTSVAGKNAKRNLGYLRFRENKFALLA